MLAASDIVPLEREFPNGHRIVVIGGGLVIQVTVRYNPSDPSSNHTADEKPGWLKEIFPYGVLLFFVVYLFVYIFRNKIMG